MDSNTIKRNEGSYDTGMVSWCDWLRGLNISSTTGWRWRKMGLIAPVNVFGKLYLTAEEISRFKSRAVAGEFFKKPTVPVRAKEVA